MVDAEKLNKYLTHEREKGKKRRKKLNVGWFIAEARDIRIYKICAVSLATCISILLRLYCIEWNYTEKIKDEASFH